MEMTFGQTFWALVVEITTAPFRGKLAAQYKRRVNEANWALEDARETAAQWAALEPKTDADWRNVWAAGYRSEEHYSWERKAVDAAVVAAERELERLQRLYEKYS